MDNSIFLNGHPIPLDLPPQLSLAVVISTIVERVLNKQNTRIASVSSGGKDIFNPEELHKPWSSFGRIDCHYRQIAKTLKKAVITLNIGDLYCEMSEISHPTMKAYANKMDADFIVINQVKVKMHPLHFEKWQMYDLLFEYDRIIFLDTDILVRPDCPDLFGMVGLEEVGGFVESDYLNRSISITGCQKLMGDVIGWRGEYLNSGVGVYSYRHKPIFERSEKGHVINFGEQDMYNYRIKQLGFPVRPLPIEFNRMGLDNYEGHLPDRLSSFIIHYAGKGWTGISEGSEQRLAKVALMKKDAKELISRFGGRSCHR
ncbi:hypothetical protein KKH56_06225 [bacterium]|nr:hypothetical protein [bacterium]